jgi:hypothetical protein
MGMKRYNMRSREREMLYMELKKRMWFMYF